ncbi:aldo/keto reductase [Glycomyces tarimensis]
MRFTDTPGVRHSGTAPVWEPPTDRQTLVRLIRTAVDLGVNLFDTADAYGLGEGERLLAEALSEAPDDVAVATKVGVVRPGPGGWVPLGHPDYLRQQIELSRRRLQRETLELVYLHRIDDAFPIADQVGALAESVAAGKIRHIGLSEANVEQLAEAVEVAPIAAVQNLYNLAERGHQDVLDKTEELGIAFVPFFPLSFDTGAFPGLAEVAKDHDATVQQIALAWLLHRGPNVVPIPGTTSVAHLKKNLDALNLALTEAELAQIGRQ